MTRSGTRDREKRRRRSRYGEWGMRPRGGLHMQVGGLPKTWLSQACLRRRTGGPAESHREYYVGEGFLRGLLLPFTGSSGKARRGGLFCAYGCRLCSLPQSPPSTGVIVGNVSGGGGRPGDVIRFAKAWGNKSLRLGFCAMGSPVPLCRFLLVEVCLGPRCSCEVRFPSSVIPSGTEP